MEDHKEGVYYFSSESVGEGHPDKLCDQISDAILDACIAQDPHAKAEDPGEHPAQERLACGALPRRPSAQQGAVGFAFGQFQVWTAVSRTANYLAAGLPT